MLPFLGVCTVWWRIQTINKYANKYIKTKYEGQNIMHKLLVTSNNRRRPIIMWSQKLFWAGNRKQRSKRWEEGRNNMCSVLNLFADFLSNWFLIPASSITSEIFVCNLNFSTMEAALYVSQSDPTTPHIILSMEGRPNVHSTDEQNRNWERLNNLFWGT